MQKSYQPYARPKLQKFLSQWDTAACNERFGAMAGVARWKVLPNRKLRGSWQVCVARHCAKPLGVKCKFFSANTGENRRSKLENVPRKTDFFEAPFGKICNEFSKSV